MNVVKISKILDVFTTIAIVGVLLYHFLIKFEKVEYLILAVLAVAIVKMIASMLKSNYYEKHYKQLEEDNEFLQRRIDELIREKENK